MRFIFLCVALMFTSLPAVAQNNAERVVTGAPAPVINRGFEDETTWGALAKRAESAIQAGRASNSVLGDLRADIAVWRDTFLDRQSLNASRIATVRSQINALGAVPENGEEDPRITARRETLNAQLRELRAPVTLAVEAYTQANGLIGEIDSLMRGRQTERVLERSQSPLNPTGWANTLSALNAAGRSIKGEISAEIVNPIRQAKLSGLLPIIFVFLAVAVVFMLRGRAWFGWLADALSSRSRRAQGVVQFILSLGQIAIPFLGLGALVIAINLTGMTGRRMEAFVKAIPYYGLLPILGHWIAGQLFPRHTPQDEHPMGMAHEQSNRAHNRLIILGYMMMLFGLAQEFVLINSFSATPAAVLIFPFGVLLAWSLYWFGHIMRRSAIVHDEDEPRKFRVGLRSAFSRGLMLAAVAGVILAAFGYANAFGEITNPAALTTILLAILLLLQRLSVDVYSMLSKGDGLATEALIPVLIGFLLMVLSLPVFAVIWGAQVTDITELWARFREGFTIGDTTISPSNFLLFAVVFVVGYTITRMIQGALRSTVLPRTKMDVGGQNAVVSGLGYVGIFLAAVIAITTAGIDLSGFAIVAGALSVGIGFGLQNIVSNFVAGIILLIERPISQGDWIEVGGQMGYVRDISVRSTRIETFDRTDVIVPNADLVSNQVTNWTRGNNVGRVIVPVGVAYGTDTDMVTSILREIAEAHPMVLLNPPPSVIFQGFGADSLDFEIRAILRDVNFVLATKSEMNHAIAKRFVAEGIEIPFGQRDIWLRNPEALDFGAKRAARSPRPKSPPKDDATS